MKRAILLLAAAPLLGAWCDPHRGCGQPLPPRYHHPHEERLPPVFVPRGRHQPPTRNPEQLRDRHGHLPPGFYTEPRREFVPLPPYGPPPPYAR